VRKNTQAGGRVKENIEDFLVKATIQRSLRGVSKFAGLCGAVVLAPHPMVSDDCSFRVYRLQAQRPGTGTLNAGEICRE
jgi:hypothetical protein